MVAAANKALSATADGNQKKPVFPGFIPLGASPQATAAALAARQAPNVLAGTGLGLNAPAQAPAMFTDGLGPRPAPQPEPAKKMGWNDVPPLRAPDNARNIYANMGVDDLKSRANLTGVHETPTRFSTDGNLTVDNWRSRSAQFDKAVSGGNYGNAIGIGMRTLAETPGAAIIDVGRGIGKAVSAVPVGGFVSGLAGGESQPSQNVQANTPAPVVQASQSQRGDGSVPGLPAALPASAPATAQPVKLGAGAYAGPGIVRIDGGSSPLFTNMTDAAGMADNQKLMGRGAPTAQNMAAMDALSGRYESEQRAMAQNMIAKEKYAADVAQAQAINKTGEMNAAKVLDDMAREKGRRGGNVDRLLKIGQSESDAADKQSARGLDTLRVKQDEARLGLDAKRLMTEQQNGEQSREAKGMEIAASKQLQSLRDRFMAATGAEQEALGKQLLTMSGKDPKSSMKENFMVVGGGQEFDQKSNQLINKPQSLIDLRTGLAVSGPPNGGSPSASFVEGGIYPLTGGGSAVFKDGKLKRVE